MGRSASYNGRLCTYYEMRPDMKLVTVKYMLALCLLSAPLAPLYAEPDGVIAAKKVNRLACTFVQTKESAMLEGQTVSSGVMYYVHPDKVRWEYTEPFSGIFVMDGDEAAFGTEGKMQKIDLAKNRLFRSISKVMFAGLSGDPLVSDSTYQVQVNDSGDFMEAVLVPVNKSMAKVMSRVLLYIRKSDLMGVRIVMEEHGGDMTRIDLDNIDTEKQIDLNIFATK